MSLNLMVVRGPSKGFFSGWSNYEFYDRTSGVFYLSGGHSESDACQPGEFFIAYHRPTDTAMAYGKDGRSYERMSFYKSLVREFLHREGTPWRRIQDPPEWGRSLLR